MESDGGVLPNLDKTIGEFQALIMWHEVNADEKVPEPVKGFDSNYDNA